MKEAMKQIIAEIDALPEGLEGYFSDAFADNLAKVREALAQSEQINTRPYYTIDELNAWADEKEKQAWRNAAIRIGEELSSVGPDGYYDMTAQQWLDWAMEQTPHGKNSLAQPEQEPVATLEDLEQEIYQNTRNFVSRDVMEWMLKRYYTHPPQRTWQGLTEWKPIETAPKDSEVLLYCNKFIPLYIGKKRYGCLGEPQQDNFEWRCSSSGRFADPTYWMPLPKSPIETAHGIKE